MILPDEVGRLVAPEHACGRCAELQRHACAAVDGKRRSLRGPCGQAARQQGPARRCPRAEGLGLALQRLVMRRDQHVAAARAAGATWQQIADALGVSRQTDHEHYG